MCLISQLGYYACCCYCYVVVVVDVVDVVVVSLIDLITKLKFECLTREQDVVLQKMIWNKLKDVKENSKRINNLQHSICNKYSNTTDR